MSKKKQATKPQEVKDWKAQLAEFKGTLPQGEGKKSTPKTRMVPGTERRNNPKPKRGRERIHQVIPQDENTKLYLSFVYKFLAGYKHNSGIYINNLLRKRSFKQYVEAIFDSFTMDLFGSVMPNVFDDPGLSFTLVRKLRDLSERKIAYFPFDYGMAQQMIALDALWRVLPKTDHPMTVYRGCNGIAKNGLNGIVSTTTDIRIARQFSRGTVLCIHLPEGMPYLDINSVRPDQEKGRDLENEIIIPPCEYKILSKKTVEKRDEPNNHYNNTFLIDVEVTHPLDLLEEVLAVLENPPEEYKQHIASKFPEMHEFAIDFLKKGIQARNNN